MISARYESVFYHFNVGNYRPASNNGGGGFEFWAEDRVGALLIDIPYAQRGVTRIIMFANETFKEYTTRLAIL